MVKKIAVINGPNMNLLGRRQPEYYGDGTWREIEEALKRLGKECGASLAFFQSNHEGDIVDFLQGEAQDLNGIILNPAAFSINGYSILEALTALEVPFVEVHMSNIYRRGGWHAQSVFAGEAAGQITGFCGQVYELGLRALLTIISE